MSVGEVVWGLGWVILGEVMGVDVYDVGGFGKVNGDYNDLDS